MAPHAQTRPEPMNSSPHHSKVKVSMTLANAIYVAGKFVAGKMEVECRADKGLGLGVIMVELVAVQELTSRDHSATSTFLHGQRLFQGPGLPPSNAVQAYPQPGDPSYPLDYHQARRGISTFLFRIPLPSSAPSSISFGSDIARVRYELRATVGVAWKGEKRLVVCKREIDVVESFEEDFSRTTPEGVVVGEFGKIWVQGTVVGGIVVSGESACVELQVKNHSNKKNTGLTLALTRTLVLPGLKPGETSPLQLSDVLTTVPFRGPEYIIPSGAEGVASLVFDVPKHARGVRGGPLEGDESEHRTTESLFEVQCIVGITFHMGIGTKDIHLDLPVPIVHPAALPEPAEYYPYHAPDPAPPPHLLPYVTPVHPISTPYLDPVQNQVWLPQPNLHTPHINDAQYFSPPAEGTDMQYYFPPPLHTHIPAYVPTRAMSAGPTPNEPSSNTTDIGAGSISPLSSQPLVVSSGNIDPEEGKGERATRVTQHLRLSSRHRSVSPQSHRFPFPAPLAGASQVPAPSLPSVDRQSIAHLRNLPPVPLPTVSAAIPVAKPVVHSPRPFLSPKRSSDGSLPKSERVEELERMAAEVGETTVDLSSDLPKATLEPIDAAQRAVNPSPPKVLESRLAGSDINKTLPVPPPATKNARKDMVSEQSGRTRIDEFFANTSTTPVPVPTSTTPIAVAQPVKLPSKAKSAEFTPRRLDVLETQAPPTPMAAVTPMKLPLKFKSDEFKAQLPLNGKGESGLDALEKRLLAEVGTRKVDSGKTERRPAWKAVGVQPINIPSKESIPDDPLNDSAISSLTLAGEWKTADREEVEIDVALELDAEHDSDEKTHKAGKSSASASSRKGSKAKGDKAKKKVKRVKDKEGEGHTRTKKKAAAKGRVTAWLGGIDPEVPPLEQELPPSPAVSKKFSPFMDDTEDLSRTDPAGDSVAKESLDVDEATAPEGGTSAPNPRSSGFVPLGTFKAGISQRVFKSISKDATVAREAKHVADIWSSSAWTPAVDPATKTSSGSPSTPVLKDVTPSFPSISPALPTAASIRTDRQVSPPSAAGAADILGAKHHNLNIKAGRPPSVPLKPPNSKMPGQPSTRIAPIISPPLDPEVKYDVRSARGGRGGRVTAISSIWASGGTGSDTQPIQDITPAPSKPLRNYLSGLVVKDIPATATDFTPVTPKLRSRGPMKSLLSASAPPEPPKRVEMEVKRPRPIIKSPSVPAIISSSHATPMLSSTASLARPVMVKPAAKLPPTVSEAPSNLGRRFQAHGSVYKSPASPKKFAAPSEEMAFGQARLRDLIKKYQGQTA